MAAPSASLALAALSEGALAEAKERIATTIRERERMFKALRGVRGVTSVYPSEGNFLLIRFADADEALSRLLGAGVGVKLIGDLLGHRSLASTSTYLRIQTDMLRDAALDMPAQVAP